METPNNVIIVGIALDPFFRAEDGQNYSRAAEMRFLLQTARAIAHKTGASIRLVSVWETKVMDIAKAALLLPNFDWQKLPLDTFLKTIRAKIQENCEKQLEDMSCELGLETSKHVITAKYPAQGLLAEADASHAALMLLGAGSKADSYFTRGFSTPLTVMASTSVPVLVIGSQCETDFSKSRLRVLLADDLRDTTERAVQASIEWISRLGTIDLLHLHVEELSLSRVQQVLGAATAELRSTVEWEKLSSDLMQALDQALHERLQKRVRGAEEFLRNRGGTLQHEVRRGSLVRDEIERAADEFNADLIVFGRHQKVHHRPYMVGRVTFQAMLSQKRAILVIP